MKSRVVLILWVIAALVLSGCGVLFGLDNERESAATSTPLPLGTATAAPAIQGTAVMMLDQEEALALADIPKNHLYLCILQCCTR